MQLNDSHKEDISEHEPILRRSDSEHRFRESSSSCEIVTVGGDHEVIDEVHVDESCQLVNADQPLCRICLDSGGEDLIAPCHCKGTQKYVHRSCLDNWRSTKEGFAFAHCTECRAAFLLRANVPPDRWCLRLKFQFLVARDHAFIFIIVLLELMKKNLFHSGHLSNVLIFLQPQPLLLLNKMVNQAHSKDLSKLTPALLLLLYLVVLLKIVRLLDQENCLPILLPSAQAHFKEMPKSAGAPLFLLLLLLLHLVVLVLDQGN